jgi:hypothetical protein
VLDGKSRFQQAYIKKTAENERVVAEAERDVAAARHEMDNIDRAGELKIPREALTPIVLKDHEHEKAIHLAEEHARIEVQKEANMVSVWLTAARSALLQPYFNAEELRELLGKLFKEQERLRGLQKIGEADKRMLELLDDTIPVLDGDYRARIRQAAFQATGGKNLGAGDNDAKRGGDSAADAEAEPDPISATNTRPDKRRGPGFTS